MSAWIVLITWMIPALSACTSLSCAARAALYASGYEELILPLPKPGIVTQESRGNDTIEAFEPLAGMCSTIMVSALTVVVSCPACRAVNSAGVAPARVSLPISRTFWSAPSGSFSPAVSAGTRSPCGTLAVKLLNVTHATPLPTITSSDSEANSARIPTRTRCETCGPRPPPAGRANAAGSAASSKSGPAGSSGSRFIEARLNLRRRWIRQTRGADVTEVHRGRRR